ncbi:unnamed protein product, partial [Ectocarpus sp. 6 AP-2014]
MVLVTYKTVGGPQTSIRMFSSENSHARCSGENCVVDRKEYYYNMSRRRDAGFPSRHTLRRSSACRQQGELQCRGRFAWRRQRSVERSVERSVAYVNRPARGYCRRGY